MRRWATIGRRLLNYRLTTTFSVEVGNGKSPYTVVLRTPDPYRAERLFNALRLDPRCKKRLSMHTIEGTQITVLKHIQPVKPV